MAQSFGLRVIRIDYFLRMHNIKSIVFFLSWSFLLNAQETLPIYSDYLSDNVYLVHPAAAGIGNCGKLRLTARQQWADIPNAPELQTLSFHTRVGDKAGVGAIIFNDKNGYHSQIGVQGTYAYHLDFGMRSDEVNQLSLAFSLMMVENSVDETNFTIPDPEITQLIQSRNYFNADIGAAYHLDGFFTYLTAKNILLTARSLYNDDFESLNLRRYLLTVGYYFGENSSVQFEPSIMTQVIERTGEKLMDLNFKMYKDIAGAQLWGGISYRRGFDGNEMEELQYITPIVGVNINRWMFSYTYTKQSGDILFESGGYHQLSLGFNLFCRPQRLSGCPNINASF